MKGSIYAAGDTGIQSENSKEKNRFLELHNTISLFMQQLFFERISFKNFSLE